MMLQYYSVKITKGARVKIDKLLTRNLCRLIGSRDIRAGRSSRLRLEIGAYFVQQRSELAALLCTQASHSDLRQAFKLLLQGLMHSASPGRQVQTHASPISLAFSRLQHALILQALDKARKLSLVASRMRNEVAQCPAGISGKEAENFTFHVCQGLAGGAQDMVLPGAKQVHDHVNGIENLVGRIGRIFVDYINLLATHR